MGRRCRRARNAGDCSAGRESARMRRAAPGRQGRLFSSWRSSRAALPRLRAQRRSDHPRPSSTQGPCMQLAGATGSDLVHDRYRPGAQLREPSFGATPRRVCGRGCDLEPLVPASSWRRDGGVAVPAQEWSLEAAAAEEAEQGQDKDDDQDDPENRHVVCASRVVGHRCNARRPKTGSPTLPGGPAPGPLDTAPTSELSGRARRSRPRARRGWTRRRRSSRVGGVPPV